MKTGITFVGSRLTASRWLGLLLILLLLRSQVQAQSFSDVSSQLPNLPQVRNGAVAWGDYDNDGRLDLLLTGFSQITGNPVSKLYRNTGSGFVDVTASQLPNLPGVYSSAVAWGDYDNDGRLDLILTGLGASGSVSRLYHNKGTGFEDVTASQIFDLSELGINSGSVAWGDYNNDGRLDLLVTGQTDVGPISRLYHNYGDRFVDVTGSQFPELAQVRNSAVGWGDYDNDGRLDLIITGNRHDGVGAGSGPDPVSQLHRNTGTDFVDVTASQLPNLPQVSSGSVAWGDYDNDGRLDLILTGASSSGNVSKLYRNTGSGFADVTAGQLPGLPQVSDGSVAWGDYDNDGRLDLMFTGAVNLRDKFSKLYHNTSSGFVDVTDSQLPGLLGLYGSSVAWGDYDNDGKLDLLLTGSTDRPVIGGTILDPISKLYRNQNPTVNAPPAAPTALISTPRPDATSVRLSWQAPTDDHTPSAALSYNLYVSDSPTSQTLVGPMANPATGFRRVVRLGNSQPTSYTLTGLTPGKTYYWSVQALDGAFAGSAFAAQQSFTTPLFSYVTTQFITLPGVGAGSVAWGDYDSNGQLDLILTGQASGGSVSKLYYNNFDNIDYDFFDVTDSELAGLPHVYLSAVAWGDYDNDGRLDLILTGRTSSGPISKLYHNTGGGFVDVTASQLPGLPGVQQGSVAWGDYNNDGRLDLLLTGASSSGNVSKLYRNTGSGFADVTAGQLPGLPQVSNSAVAWGDYDRDGRLDLLLTGASSSGNVSKLYRNTGSGFADVTAGQFTALPQVAGAAVAWGDYDNDGRLDLLLTGYTGSSPISKLYRNTGTGFVDVTASQLPGLPPVYQSAVAWGDYDNDGRLDLLFTGATSVGSGFVSRLYRNTASGFVDVTASQVAGLPQVQQGSVAWGDYNNDGKLDLLFTGITSSGLVSQLYRNQNPTANAAPTAPTSLSSTLGPNATSMQLSWQAPTDDHTPQAALSYNLYVSDQPQGQTVLGAMADLGTGYRRVVRLGNSQPTSYTLTGLSPGTTYYWSVQALDGAFAGGAFAPQQRFTPYLFSNVTSQLPSLPQVGIGSVAWGDYDNDGRLDLILTGQASGSSVSQLYRNTASGFVDVTAGQFTGLPQVSNSAVAWGDYNNDGRLDLILTGSVSDGGSVSKLYRNTASGFVDVTAGQLPGLPQVFLGSVAWGDYDNDGKLDLIITGNVGSSRVSKLYHNTPNGFVDVTASQLAGLPGVSNSAVAWGDYDNDGRLDLIITGGANGGSNVSKLYRNTGSGFVDVTAGQLPGLPGLRGSSVAWGDYDSDGRLDLLITGNISTEYVSRVYHNTGSGFVDVTASQLPGLPAVNNGSVAWGDYDNDGRLDLLLTGSISSGGGAVSQLYHNTGSGFEDQSASLPNRPGVYLSEVAWGDYDNDGKLDLILTGLNGTNGVPVSQLYHNLSPVANAAPTAPTSLSSSPGPDGTSVRLSWQPPTDDRTPQAGLNYNLYVSDSPTSQTVVGAMADLGTGYRRVVRLGNSQPTSYTLTGLTPGQTYYWSVQALDVSFGGSAFAPPQSFATPPVPDLTALLYLRPSLLYGTSAVSLVMDVVELNGVASSGLIRVRIPKVSQLSLSFDPTLEGNQGWSFSSSNASYYELTTTGVIEGGGYQRLTLSGVFNAGATSGILSVSAVVLGGGEARLTNNADADKLEYFQQ